MVLYDNLPKRTQAIMTAPTDAVAQSISHRHFDCLDSTNSRLLSDLGDTDGGLDTRLPQLYTTSQQTAGKGQHGRTWAGGQGNVFLSLYVPMTAHAKSDAILSLDSLTGRLSLLVAYYLQQIPIIHHINLQRQEQKLPVLGIKWPNDLGYLDPQTRCFYKLSGILIEPAYAQGDLLGVVVGVGMNVVAAPQLSDGPYRATCLQDLLKHKTSLPATADLYRPITRAIALAIQRHNRLDDPTQEQAECLSFIQDFNQVHLLSHQRVAVLGRDGLINHQGICLGIDDQAALLIDTADGRREKVWAGTVRLL